VSTLLRKPWNIALRAGVPTWPQLVCRAQLHHLECFGRTRRVATRCNAPGAHRARHIAMHVRGRAWPVLQHRPPVAPQHVGGPLVITHSTWQIDPPFWGYSCSPLGFPKPKMKQMDCVVLPLVQPVVILSCESSPRRQPVIRKHNSGRNKFRMVQFFRSSVLQIAGTHSYATCQHCARSSACTGAPKRVSLCPLWAAHSVHTLTCCPLDGYSGCPSLAKLQLM
jgi:hypothetical protein